MRGPHTVGDDRPPGELETPAACGGARGSLSWVRRDSDNERTAGTSWASAGTTRHMLTRLLAALRGGQAASRPRILQMGKQRCGKVVTCLSLQSR